jgi:hypothetical protein
VGDETPCTVLVDSSLTDVAVSVGALNRTGAEKSFFLFFLEPLVVESKIGAGAQIAVKLRGVVAFFILRIEGTKINLLFDHILKSKILDYLLVI